MAVQRLSAHMTANVAGAVNGFNQVNQTLGRTQQVAQRTTRDFTGLSRIIQDLPFGLIGIQNNLTQVLPAAAGLGLAVSALTAGFTFAQIGLQNWAGLFPSANDRIKEHVKALHEARQAQKDYLETLEDITKVRLQGAQAAQEELVQLKTLYDATQNQNISLKDRRRLVDELQEQYPKYFANIKDETILAGGAKDAYDRLAASILSVARARAAQESLVEIQKEVLTIEQQQIDNQIELQKLSAKTAETQAKNSKKAADNTGNAGAAVVGNLVEVQKLQDKVNEKTKEGSKLQEAKNKLLERAKRLTGEVNAEVQKDPNALLDPTGSLSKSGKEAKIKIPVRIEPINNIDPHLMDDLLKETVEGIKNADEKTDLQKAIEGRLKKSLEKKIPARVNIAPTISSETYSDAEKLGDEMAGIIQNAIAPAFVNFGEAIGAAIASGENPIEAAGKSILASIGDLISQMGKALIQYGVQKSILDKITLGGFAIPGVAAIAAGVAAVAVGTLIKNSFKPKKFAEGGLAFGPTLGLIGEGQGTTRSNPEVVAPLDKLKKYIGGGQNNFPAYLPVHELSGDTLRLWYARSNKSGGMFQ